MLLCWIYVADNNERYFGLNVKWPIFWSDFNQIWSFCRDFQVNPPITKLRGNPVQWTRTNTSEQTGRQDKETDGQTNGGYVEANQTFCALLQWYRRDIVTPSSVRYPLGSITSQRSSIGRFCGKIMQTFLYSESIIIIIIINIIIINCNWVVTRWQYRQNK
jgi:hypothetical protein